MEKLVRYDTVWWYMGGSGEILVREGIGSVPTPTHGQLNGCVSGKKGWLGDIDIKLHLWSLTWRTRFLVRIKETVS